MIHIKLSGDYNTFYLGNKKYEIRFITFLNEKSIVGKYSL
jgi:hypothetical protein